VDGTSKFLFAFLLIWRCQSQVADIFFSLRADAVMRDRTKAISERVMRVNGIRIKSLPLSSVNTTIYGFYWVERREKARSNVYMSAMPWLYCVLHHRSRCE
jgi:hypothetical protein